MPRLIPLALPLALLPLTARADGTEIAAMIERQGLAATEAHLAALPAPDATELFALGAVRFLGGIERAGQQLYGSAMPMEDFFTGMPFLRLSLPPNPAPQPFDPALLDHLFGDLSADMAGAIAALEQVGPDTDVALPIDPSLIWLDIDGNAARSPGEGLMEIAGAIMMPGVAPPPPRTIRFDTADAAWLLAYAHLLAGIGETVASVETGPAIAQVLQARQALADTQISPRARGYGAGDYADWIDMAAMVLIAIDQVPDAARTGAARDHLLATIAANRDFWTRVARETDNDAEWIPNKHQVSATGLAFPPEIGPRWLLVLDEAEKLLTGEILLPWWRAGPPWGLDLAAMLQDPPSLSLPQLVQGAALLPYLRQGRLIDAAALRQFEALLGGNAGLYMVILN